MKKGEEHQESKKKISQTSANIFFLSQIYVHGIYVAAFLAEGGSSRNEKQTHTNRRVEKKKWKKIHRKRFTITVERTSMKVNTFFPETSRSKCWIWMLSFVLAVAFGSFSMSPRLQDSPRAAVKAVGNHWLREFSLILFPILSIHLYFFFFVLLLLVFTSYLFQQAHTRSSFTRVYGTNFSNVKTPCVRRLRFGVCTAYNALHIYVCYIFIIWYHYVV